MTCLKAKKKDFGFGFYQKIKIKLNTALPIIITE
jgi:hypothetical protein